MSDNETVAETERHNVKVAHGGRVLASARRRDWA
jgi:hypothetical protein